MNNKGKGLNKIARGLLHNKVQKLIELTILENTIYRRALDNIIEIDKFTFTDEKPPNEDINFFMEEIQRDDLIIDNCLYMLDATKDNEFILTNITCFKLYISTINVIRSINHTMPKTKQMLSDIEICVLATINIQEQIELDEIENDEVEE